MSLFLFLACAEVIGNCSTCQGLGGAWLPGTDTCNDTCEEQAEGVLCVESVCPADAPDAIEDAETCESCILAGGGWATATGECAETCTDATDCSTTRCPDGSG